MNVDAMAEPLAVPASSVARSWDHSKAELIDFPVPVEVAAYERALEEAVRLLRAERGVLSVYQIGGVSAPGVSDLDMVVVFGDGAVANSRVVEVLRASYPYLFIHNLYGASRTHFVVAQRYSLFHNYRLLWGEDFREQVERARGRDEALLERQVALEYLLKLYVNMVLQREYRTIKVRGHLLHAKAVAYDLDFLGIESGELYELTQQIIEWRCSWFKAPPTPEAFAATFDRFFVALVALLEELLEEQTFHFPGEPPHPVARNLLLRPGERLGFQRRGIRLPSLLSRVGNRYFKLSNRLNRFNFTVPAATEPPPPVLAERFRLVRKMAQYNQKHLPRFDVLTSSL